MEGSVFAQLFDDPTYPCESGKYAVINKED